MEKQTDFIPDGMNAFERNVKRIVDCLLALELDEEICGITHTISTARTTAYSTRIITIGISAYLQSAGVRKKYSTPA